MQTRVGRTIGQVFGIVGRGAGELIVGMKTCHLQHAFKLQGVHQAIGSVEKIVVIQERRQHLRMHNQSGVNQLGSGFTQSLQFLAQHPERIREADLRTIPGYKEAWAAGSARRRAKESERNESPDNAADETATPHEIINREVSALRNELRSRLLDAILAQSPEFFEQLVLDVLIAMGYGGSREDAAEHLGQSGDEGIDGCINQDTLGLDQVMVQAKRYRPDRTVSRAEVQGFIGSLSGQGVTKGVFITTSTFVQSAHEFVARGLTTKVVLVDGEMLIDLMIKHHIGARVSHTYELYELDQNYFDDDE